MQCEGRPSVHSSGGARGTWLSQRPFSGARSNQEITHITKHSFRQRRPPLTLVFAGGGGARYPRIKTHGACRGTGVPWPLHPFPARALLLGSCADRSAPLETHVVKGCGRNAEAGRFDWATNRLKSRPVFKSGADFRCLPEPPFELRPQSVRLDPR